MGTTQRHVRKSQGSFCNVSRGGKNWFFKLGSVTLGFYLRILGVISAGDQRAKMIVGTSAGLSSVLPEKKIQRCWKEVRGFVK